MSYHFSLDRRRRLSPLASKLGITLTVTKVQRYLHIHYMQPASYNQFMVWHATRHPISAPPPPRLKHPISAPVNETEYVTHPALPMKLQSSRHSLRRRSVVHPTGRERFRLCEREDKNNPYRNHPSIRDPGQSPIRILASRNRRIHHVHLQMVSPASRENKMEISHAQIYPSLNSRISNSSDMSGAGAAVTPIREMNRVDAMLRKVNCMGSEDSVGKRPALENLVSKGSA